MKKYRKKPTVIEAIKLTKENIREVYSILYEKPTTNSNIASDRWSMFEDMIKRNGLEVPTPEGTVMLKMGNYLLRGYTKKLGVHYWPVDVDYFEENYEEVRQDKGVG